MSRVKQQHYVPRFYLRRFANNAEQLYAFDKVNRRSFFTSIQNVAAEHNYLDIPGLEEGHISEQFMETRYLKVFEDEARQALGEIVNQLESGEFRRIRGKRRRQLARFIAIQSMRTPEHRRQVSEIDRLVEEAKLRIQLERTQPELANAVLHVEAPPEREVHLHALALLNLPLIEQLTRALLDLNWIVFESPSGNPFWASDNPIVRYSHHRDPLQRLTGFASAGVEIACPISPRYLIALVDAREFHFLASARGERSLLATEFVDFYNALQVTQATRFIYASTDQFDHAREICEKAPEITDPNRLRVPIEGGPWSNLGKGTFSKNRQPNV